MAIGPVRRGTPFIDVIRALESGQAPLAVRTWGGGMLARLLEAEAMTRGEPLDAVPLDDPVTVAELIAVSAALAALRVVRVYAAALAGSGQQAAGSDADNMLSTSAPRRGWMAHVRQWRGGRCGDARWRGNLGGVGRGRAPSVRLSAIGYGMSEGAPHLLRCWLGTPYNAGSGPVSSGTRTAAVHRHPHDAGDDH